MIANDQELHAMFARIRTFQEQVAHLRIIEVIVASCSSAKA